MSEVIEIMIPNIFLKINKLYYINGIQINFFHVFSDYVKLFTKRIPSRCITYDFV